MNTHRDWTGPPMAVLLNKADLIGEEEIEELKAWYKENCRADQVRL
jgi:GTP-binding protein Era